MADGGAPPPLHRRLDELLALDQDARFALVEAISAKGFEPGCWMRVDDADLTHSPTAARDLIDSLEQMDKLIGDVSRIDEFAGEHTWQPPSDGGDAWIIISQSCDLIRDVRDEPLVQLARLRRADEHEDLSSWWRNSARWIPLDPTGERSRYYVDLRVQAFLPKQMLADVEVRHALPTDGDFAKQRPRTRFALRVGQRYSRMGIPTAIVQTVSGPIGQATSKGSTLRKELDAAFSEWLLLPGDQAEDPLALIAVTPHADASDAFRAAEDLFFQRFWNALPETVRTRLDEERSQVIALDELRVPVWMSAWKLDLDFLTYGSKGVPNSPEPQA